MKCEYHSFPNLGCQEKFRGMKKVTSHIMDRFLAIRTMRKIIAYLVEG